MPDASGPALEAVLQNEENLDLLQQLGVQSFVAVPLISHADILGAFAFVSTSPSRGYREEEARFAEQFARLASLAVENAQLHRTAQRASAGRDEVLSIVAHDLRNHLNMLVLSLDLISTQQPPSKATDGMRACQRMNRLIQDILDVARLEAGTLAIQHAPIEPSGLLDEAVETQRASAAKASIKLDTKFAIQLPDVLGDRGRLLQVFDNLIGNAIKFTPAGGWIAIGSKPLGDEVLMWVADTGAGMSPEQAAHIFDRFWQGIRMDRRGAGLGLSIVKYLIETHGGRVWVESELDTEARSISRCLVCGLKPARYRRRPRKASRVPRYAAHSAALSAGNECCILFGAPWSHLAQMRARARRHPS